MKKLVVTLLALAVVGGSAAYAVNAVGVQDAQMSFGACHLGATC